MATLDLVPLLETYDEFHAELVGAQLRDADIFCQVRPADRYSHIGSAAVLVAARDLATARELLLLDEVAATVEFGEVAARRRRSAAMLLLVVLVLVTVSVVRILG